MWGWVAGWRFKAKGGKNTVTDEDDSMTVEEVLKVSQTLSSGAFWHSRGWKSCPRPSSPTSHLFSHIWMWFLLIFQALWNDSQTEPLKNYVLLAELDTLVHDVCGWEECTDKHSDSSKTPELHEQESLGYVTGSPPPKCQQSFLCDVCWRINQVAAWLWGLKLQLKLRFEDCLWVYQKPRMTGNSGKVQTPGNCFKLLYILETAGRLRCYPEAG